MPDVKIKKSVLQSIIRKSLSESGPKGTHDVSQRLTIGPERASLPSLLPLSPSDRMSTQLDVERPPVDDPDYVPANSRELGYALQALAEMVPSEQVDKAYMAFQKIIERLQEEGSEDEDVQLESIRRKNLILRALMEQSQSDADDDADDDDDDRAGAVLDAVRGDTPLTAREIMHSPRYSGVNLGSDGSGEPDKGSSHGKMSDDIDDDIKRNFGLRDNHIDKLEKMVGPKMLGLKDIDTFKLILSTWDNPDDEVKAKVYAALEMADEGKLIKFVKEFNNKYSVPANRAKPVAPAKPKRGTRQDLSVTAAGEGNWRDMAAFYGYKAESGIRQGVLKDVIALRGPLTIIKPSESDFRYIIKQFERAILKGDTEELDYVLGPELREKFQRQLKKDPKNPDRYLDPKEADEVFEGPTFRYFRGRAFIGALDEFGTHELRSGRTVRDAFIQQAFDEGNLTEREIHEIKEFGDRGHLTGLLYEFMEDYESTKCIDLLDWAAERVVEDDIAAEKKESGEATGHEGPALPTLRQVIRPGTVSQIVRPDAAATSRKKK